jgi:hypothetical protein
MAWGNSLWTVVAAVVVCFGPVQEFKAIKKLSAKRRGIVLTSCSFRAVQ